MFFVDEDYSSREASAAMVMGGMRKSKRREKGNLDQRGCSHHPAAVFGQQALIKGSLGGGLVALEDLDFPGGLDQLGKPVDIAGRPHHVVVNPMVIALRAAYP